MRAGVDPQTGKWLSGWPHCAACLAHLFTTRIGTVPWRRLYGSALKDLQDRNANADTVLEFFAAIAAAIDLHEPGFRLTSINLKKGGRDGRFLFECRGDFYPLGHLGDYSITENRITEFHAIAFTPGGVIAS